MVRPFRAFAVSFFGLALVLAISSPVAAGIPTQVYGDPGSSNYSSAHAVAVGPEGSIYVLGVFSGTFQGVTAIDAFDIWMAKIGGDGSLSWLLTWDAPGIAGQDWSDINQVSSEAGPWVRGVGQVGIDGAGNVIGGFAGTVVVATTSGTALGTHELPLGAYRLTVSASVDGGYMLIGSPNSVRILGSYDPTGAERWVVPVPADDTNLVALSGGGAAVAYEPERLSFQLPSVRVDGFSGSGDAMWSTTLVDRCLGNQDPSSALLDRGGEIAVHVRAARQTIGDPCDPLDHRLVTLSGSNGSRLSEETTKLAWNIYWCGDLHAGILTGGLQSDLVDAETCAPEIAVVAFGNGSPLIELMGRVDGFALMEVGSPPAGQSEYGVVRWELDGAALVAKDIEYLGPKDGFRPHDIALAPDGPVVVGRAFNTAWISTNQGLSQSASLAATTGGAAVLTGSAFVSSGTFLDDNTNAFEGDAEWLAEARITLGCNPPANTNFCPTRAVTRGQMAALIHRALPGLPEKRASIDFIDDDDSVFEADIEWLYSRGVTQGTSATTFAPNRAVTRGQMAAFLVRALGYSDDGGGDLFVDDDDSIFKADIDRLGTAGVTRGCNPPANDRFCPSGVVTRGQMAAFLHRALGS